MRAVLLLVLLAGCPANVPPKSRVRIYHTLVDTRGVPQRYFDCDCYCCGDEGSHALADDDLDHGPFKCVDRAQMKRIVRTAPEVCAEWPLDENGMPRCTTGGRAYRVCQ